MLNSLLEGEKCIIVVSTFVENYSFEVVCFGVVRLYSQYLIKIVFRELELLHL